MIELRLSSVQASECDTMGHFNVRFYVARAVEGLASLAAALGIEPNAGSNGGVELVAIEHHLRFIREIRAGMPFAVLGGITGIEGDVLKVYQEFRHIPTDQVAAGFLADVRLVDRETRAPLTLPPVVREKAAALAVEVPAAHGPRGLTSEAPRPKPSIAEAEALGLVHCLRGPIVPEDCDPSGFMRSDAYIARVWEGVPYLMAKRGGRPRPEDRRVGGAALEYRLIYRKTPCAGDLIGMWSGLRSVGSKTSIWSHWLFDLATGESVATAEAVTIALDLDTRTAIGLSEEERQTLAQHVVPGLSI